MPKKTNISDTIVSKIRKQGAYVLPAGGVLTDLHLAAFGESTSRRTVVDDLIYPEKHDGVPCIVMGSRYLIRVDALEAFIKVHEKPQKRQRRRGGNKRE